MKGWGKQHMARTRDLVLGAPLARLDMVYEQWKMWGQNIGALEVQRRQIVKQTSGRPLQRCTAQQLDELGKCLGQLLVTCRLFRLVFSEADALKIRDKFVH